MNDSIPITGQPEHAMNVRIQRTDGATTITDMDSGEDLSREFYAYRIESRVGKTPKATLFGFANEIAIEAKGECVETTHALIVRAKEIAANAHPAVAVAFAELFGAPMKD